MTKSMEMLSRFAFGTASLVLMAMSLALVIYGTVEVIVGIRTSWSQAGDALLAAIGYVVISLAVFDVAKYFIEEEVIRSREMRQMSEARRSLTKFISTIAIWCSSKAWSRCFGSARTKSSACSIRPRCC